MHCRAAVPSSPGASPRRRLSLPPERRRLVEVNLGLVGAVAGDYIRRVGHAEEVLAEGRLGLVIAACRYDAQRTNTFGAYAKYWIRTYIQEYIRNLCGPVRIGTARPDRKILRGLGKAKRSLTDNGCSLTSEAIAAALGVSVDDLERMLQRLNGSDVSLDAGHDHSAAWGQEGMTPEEEIAEAEEIDYRRRLLRDQIRYLAPAERIVIRGLHLRDPPATYKELALYLKCKQKTIQIIEHHAIEQLRARMR